VLPVKCRFRFSLCVAVLSVSGLVWADCNAKDLPKFEQFPVKTVYGGKPHDPVLRTHLERMFRTSIREAVSEGVNFAGHYVIAVWGCGTGCIQFVVVDAVTGTIFDPPFHAVYFHYSVGASRRWPDFDATGRWWCDEYEDWPARKPKSRLLVVEGCVSDETDARCGRTYFEMTPAGLKQVYFDPDLLPDGKVAPP